jgi:predicted metal-dependent hydrolase
MKFSKGNQVGIKTRFGPDWPGARCGAKTRSGGLTIRERVFLDWYRRELRKRAKPLVERWAAEYGIATPIWGIKRMKTKWGTCNIEARRVWLNLELIKKPPQCLGCVIVHELAHFFERNHTEQFVALLDRMLPQWRLVRDELNAEPLAHEDWVN